MAALTKCPNDAAELITVEIPTKTGTRKASICPICKYEDTDGSYELNNPE